MNMLAVGAVELLVVAALLVGGGAGGAPLGGTPLPPDAGLQAAAPPECLLYAAHHGLAAPDAKSSNHFEQLLAEPETQAFLAELNRVAEQALRLVPPNDEPAKLLSTTLPTLVKTLLGRPSILYVADASLPPQAPGANAAFVIHAGEQTAAFRDAVEQWERLLLSKIPPQLVTETQTIEGVQVRRLPFPAEVPPVVWGADGEYLFIAVGDQEAANLLKRLHQRGPAPQWLTDLTREARIPRLGGLIYFNFSQVYAKVEPLLQQAAAVGLPFDVNRVLESLGLRQLRYLALASGLNEKTAVSKFLIGHEADAKGIFTLLGGKPIEKTDLAEIPRSADFAFAARVDGSAIFDQVVDTVRQIDPNAFDQIAAGLDQAETQIGFSPKRDLLDGLGDLWTIYNSPTEGGSLLTGVCLSVSVQHREKIDRVIEQLLRIAAAEAGGGGKPAFAVRKTTLGAETINYVQFLREPIPVAPAWCLKNDRLIVALSPQMVRAHLARPADAGSLADLDSVAEQLAGGDVTAISYADTRFGMQVLYSYLQYGVTMGASALEKETGIQADLSKFPSFTAIGPHLQPTIGVVRNSATVWSAESYAVGPSMGPVAVVGLGMGLLLPQVQLARETARQNTARNQLRSIAIAAFNYETTTGKPLPRAITSAEGKPLLSWRVALLPYLDRQDLYEKFRLNEPWDSDHNRTLIAEMPSFYKHPSIPHLGESGATLMQIPVGAGTLYGDDLTKKSPQNGGKAVWFVVADPEHAVVWTQPEDLEVSQESPFDVLHRADGSLVNAAMTDGSVGAVNVYTDSPEEREFLQSLFPNK